MCGQHLAITFCSLRLDGRDLLLGDFVHCLWLGGGVVAHRGLAVVVFLLSALELHRMLVVHRKTRLLVEELLVGWLVRSVRSWVGLTCVGWLVWSVVGGLQKIDTL